MARVSKQSKKVKKTPQQPVSEKKKSLVAVSETTPQGDKFFKTVMIGIVLIVLAVALWFGISAIIDANKKDTSISSNQYITLEDAKLYNADQGLEDASNKKFADALQDIKIDTIYIVFFNDEYSSLDDTANAREKSVNKEVEALIYEILAKGTASEEDEDLGYVTFEGQAFFIVRTSTETEWKSFIGDMDGLVAPGISPALLTFNNTGSWTPTLNNYSSIVQALETISANLSNES